MNNFYSFEYFNKALEENFHDWRIFLLGPAVTTALLIFAYPYLNRFVLKISLEHKQKQIEIKKEIEKKDLLTEEESIELRSNVVLLKHEYFDLFKGNSLLR